MQENRATLLVETWKRDNTRINKLNGNEDIECRFERNFCPTVLHILFRRKGLLFRGG